MTFALTFACIWVQIEGMEVLAAVNILLVGVWVGMYLFTTYVVSPAFKQLFPDAAERSAHRRVVGRIYARVNGPLTALMLAVAVALGLWQGWSLALVAELVLLVLIGGLVAAHVRQADGGALPPAWLTNVTLGAVMLLSGAAVLV